MKALVTGGAGFVGTALVKLLEHEGHEVYVCDPKANAVDDFKTMPMFAYDTIFHLAATHFLPITEANPRATLGMNMIDFDRMLRDLPHAPAVVLASSAAVYPFSPHAAQEHYPAQPSSVYGLSKFGAEMALRNYAKRTGAPATAARLFNVVGRGDPWAHLLPRIAEDVNAGREPVVGNVEPRRDYVHVSDVARALVLLASAPPGFRAYNVCTGTATSVEDVLQMFGVETYLSKNGRAVDGDLIGCPDKIARDYGWQARRDVSYAIAELKDPARV